MPHNSLPGFDLWLTHNPDEDVPEPTARHLAKALEQLQDEAEEGDEPASFEMIHARAWNIMQDEINEAQASEDEHILNNFLDDRDEQTGRGP